MRCEECLPLIEEFADGELDRHAAETVSAHLIVCAACADVLDQLGREQDLYALYRREIEVTPALWQSVRARIDAEQEEPPPTRPDALARMRGWLAGAALSLGLLRFNPAFVSALVLITIGATVGSLIYLRPSEISNTPEIVRTIELASYKGEDLGTEPATESAVSGEVEGLAPLDGGGPEAASGARRPGVTTARNERIDGAKARAAAARASEAAEGGEVTPHNYDSLPRYVEAAARLSPDDDAGAEDGAHTLHTSPDEAEVARHIEKARTLLRSFRNSSFADADASEGLSYERRLSRLLLSENILLRRDAENQGDRSTQALLNSLEPFLLDIANIRDKPSEDDVSSIKERIQKNEIIAALQVY